MDPSIFYVNTQRKTLFKNKNFVFLISDQFEKFSLIIKFAHGNPIGSFNDEEDAETFCKKYKNAFIVAPEGAKLKLNTNTKQKIKKMHELEFQLIKEDDIGLAILNNELTSLSIAGF